MLNGDKIDTCTCTEGSIKSQVYMYMPHSMGIKGYCVKTEE